MCHVARQQIKGTDSKCTAINTLDANIIRERISVAQKM